MKHFMVTTLAAMVVVGLMVIGVPTSTAANSQAVISIQPEYLVLIYNTGVHFVPNVQADIFYYQGNWFRRYDREWARARSYRGPWINIDTISVPGILIELPLDHRTAFDSYGQVPYRYIAGQAPYRTEGLEEWHYAYPGYSYRPKRNYNTDVQVGVILGGGHRQRIHTSLFFSTPGFVFGIDGFSHRHRSRNRHFRPEHRSRRDRHDRGRSGRGPRRDSRRR